MPEVKFINERDARILLIDLCDISRYQDLPGLVDKATQLAQSADESGSLRTVVDLSGTRINGDVIRSLKRLSRSNGRYAKATAFVGLNTFWSSVLSAFLKAAGKKNHRVIQSRREALLWLVQQ